MIKRDLYYERIPTKSLREDVRLLGFFLGNVIKDQEGTNFYQLVERIRLLSKVNKKKLNQKKPNTQLIIEINKLNPEKLFKLTRSFSHILNLMNLAESLEKNK
jgi:phosphoenolpyruvate carboxylase